MRHKKVSEKCAYCASKKITHPKTINIKKAISSLVNPWSSSSTSKIKIERCECICCCSCGANYQKVKMNVATLINLSNSLFPLRSALQDFRNIFNSDDFSVWKDHVKEIVQPKKGILHIVFRLCKKLAYLDCQKVQGRFVIVAVGVL